MPVVPPVAKRTLAISAASPVCFDREVIAGQPWRREARVARRAVLGILAKARAYTRRTRRSPATRARPATGTLEMAARPSGIPRCQGPSYSQNAPWARASAQPETGILKMAARPLELSAGFEPADVYHRPGNLPLISSVM